MTQDIDATSRFFRSSDGLRLHMLEFSPPAPAGLPVVCLPGLSRTAEDFRLLAGALSAAGRRVLALDYRGRGLSDWDSDWKRYSLDVEGADILHVLSGSGVAEAVFIGTSRGGLNTMRLARKHPGLVQAAVLNDIGPTIDVPGLCKIKGYIGKLPPLNSLAEAAALIRLSASPAFPAVTPAEWEIFARQSFVERDGKWVAPYDPKLSHTLDAVAPDMETPDFWEDFAALRGVPLLVLRGETSDLFSVETLREMAQAHPGMESHTVPGQGHAPLLLDAPTIARVVEFLPRAP